MTAENLTLAQTRPQLHAQLRTDLPLTQKLAYFQTGSYGPTPNSVLQVVQENMRFFNHEGAATPKLGTLMAAREAAVKQQLADFLSVRTSELAWTPNTSHAMQRILHSIHWQPGDEFIISSAEHVSLQGACRVLQQQYGVMVKTIPAQGGDDLLLASLPAALTDRTRLVCLSHVSTIDGRRLPVAQAAAIAHRLGVPVMVDGAQSVGQFPVDIASLGCDYYFASGHKWLLGPMGLGFIWIAPEKLEGFRPDFVPDVSPWQKPGDPRPPITAAARVEQGTHNYAIPIGLGRALEIVTNLGLEHIESYTGQLAGMVFQEVGQWPGVQIASPMDPEHSTGLLALTFDGYDEPRLRHLIAQLQEEGIVVKFQPEITAMRISIACFNTEEEVQRLLEALKRYL